MAIKYIANYYTGINIGCLRKPLYGQALGSNILISSCHTYSIHFNNVLYCVVAYLQALVNALKRIMTN